MSSSVVHLRCLSISKTLHRPLEHRVQIDEKMFVDNPLAINFNRPGNKIFLFQLNRIRGQRNELDPIATY